MSAAAARIVPHAGLDDAVVVAAEIAAGHDGAAELLVRLRHGNGAESALALDPATGFDLLRAAGAVSLAGLVGRPWAELVRGIT